MDKDTAIGGPHGRFPSTQVSLLEAAAAGVPGDALDRVIALYWKPVYRYIRFRFGKDNEDAKDLTQGFFAAALQRDFFTCGSPGWTGPARRPVQWGHPATIERWLFRRMGRASPHHAWKPGTWTYGCSIWSVTRIRA
jgi:hypothetical protein